MNNNAQIQTPTNMSAELESDWKKEKKLKRKAYEKKLRGLQAELCRLQDWVKHKGLRVMIVFEGRDGAGREARYGPSRSG